MSIGTTTITTPATPATTSPATGSSAVSDALNFLLDRAVLQNPEIAATAAKHRSAIAGTPAATDPQKKTGEQS